VLNDEEIKKKPLTERWQALQTKLAPHGKFGQEVLKQRFQIEQEAEKQRVQQEEEKFKERDLKRKEAEDLKKQQDEANKVKTKDADIFAIGRARGIPDKEVIDFINRGGSVEGAKAAWDKPKKSDLSPLGKKISEGQGVQITDTIKKAEEFAPTIQGLDKLEALVPKLSGVGKVKAYNPASPAWGDSAEFEATANTVLAPVFKLYNPSGPLAEKKVALLRSVLKPNWYDTDATKEAKIDAIRALAQPTIDRAARYKQALVDYDNDPPPSVIYDIEKQFQEDQKIIDRFDEKALEKGEIKIGEGQKEQPKSEPRADGKIKVKDKSTGKEGFIIPAEGWEDRFERL
jgi:hypothetical protein